MPTNSCLNCKFYEPITHRGQRYPKGECKAHGIRRISDGWTYYQTVSTPHEHICDLHQPAPVPIFAVVNGEFFQIPEVLKGILLSQGWRTLEPVEIPDKTFIYREVLTNDSAKQGDS